MVWLKRMLTASLLTAALALVLSVIPAIEQRRSQSETDIAVFHPAGHVALEEDNLIDFMLQLSLQANIVRVDWNHSILSVDIAFDAATAQPQQIYEDLYEIASMSLGGTSNVRQVLIRVLDGSRAATARETARLLIALDAKRDQLGKESAEAAAEQERLEQYLRDRFRVTYTPEWQRRYGI